jgi:signal transduction histidine kinase
MLPEIIAISFFVTAVVLAITVAILLRKKAGNSVVLNKSTVESQIEPADLAGLLAHEIKNPLSTIKINLKLISEDLDDLKQLQKDNNLHGGLGINENKLTAALRKTVIVRQETERLEQIIDGFLRYTGKIEISPACVDINKVISDLVDFYTPRAWSQSIVIRQGLAGVALVCRIDADLIKQALLNIFINAQQAMEKGGELLIRTSRSRKYAIIQISDTGSGIEPQRLEKIFDVYYSTKPGGRGLGLPIARKIIQAHNGAINIDSDPGKGTSVTIKLPLENSA